MSERPSTSVTIKPPNLKMAEFTIVGVTPYCQNAFPEKAKLSMMAKMASPKQTGKREARPVRDYEADLRDATHIDRKGKPGIPASAIRTAMIDACRLTDVKMTMAKMSVFVWADTFDERTGAPLVTITKGKPKRLDSPMVNDNGGCDIRIRPLWDEGWEARVVLRWDADQFTLDDVTNLLARAGGQVGIGAGRNFSKACGGIGWGCFEIKGK